MCDREVRIYWEKSNGYLVEVNLVLNCLDVGKIIEWWPICESSFFVQFAFIYALEPNKSETHFSSQPTSFASLLTLDFFI